MNSNVHEPPPVKINNEINSLATYLHSYSHESFESTTEGKMGIFYIIPIPTSTTADTSYAVATKVRMEGRKEGRKEGRNVDKVGKQKISIVHRAFYPVRVYVPCVPSNFPPKKAIVDCVPSSFPTHRSLFDVCFRADPVVCMQSCCHISKLRGVL